MCPEVHDLVPENIPRAIGRIVTAKNQLTDGSLYTSERSRPSISNPYGGMKESKTYV